MSLGTNPFYKRASEQTGDQEFVDLFSPDVLDRLSADHFQGKVTIVRSPPGGGKTSLLRVLTPGVLRAFCNATSHDNLRDTVHALSNFGVITANRPNYLAVNLSCATGYADLSPTLKRDVAAGTFRALLNSRIVQRSLVAIIELLDLKEISRLSQVEVALPGTATFLHIPNVSNAQDLYDWATRTERAIYADLDRLGPDTGSQKQIHSTLEATRWLASVVIRYKGKTCTWQRMLMLDDVHKLQRSQRELLLDETTSMRAPIPIWLAERTIALSAEEMLSQGVREGRDYLDLNLHTEWRETRSKKVFSDFVRSVVERRVRADSVVRGSFESCLRDSLNDPEQIAVVTESVQKLHNELIPAFTDRMRARYQEWITATETETETKQQIAPLEKAMAWQKLAIRISRDQRKDQFDLDLSPLNIEELEARDSSGLNAAAERLFTKRYGIPYYYSMDRLIQLATSNIEEFLGMAAQLYERLAARHTLNLPTQISAADQEHLVTEHAKKRFEAIRRSHTHGDRAQTLLRAIGSFCRERTYEPNAPYAPGVTGVAITMQDLRSLLSPTKGEQRTIYAELVQVLKECVAENLIDVRLNVKQGGTEWCVLYVSRLMGVVFDLPPSYGGWQRVPLAQLQLWMTSGYPGKKLAFDLL
jgi:hypothetical protein